MSKDAVVLSILDIRRAEILAPLRMLSKVNVLFTLLQWDRRPKATSIDGVAAIFLAPGMLKDFKVLDLVAGCSEWDGLYAGESAGWVASLADPLNLALPDTKRVAR